jgi:hypothetical protein
MGSIVSSGEGDEGGVRPEEAGLDMEGQAADATGWLAGCRATRERGVSDHEVGATEIGDAGLAGLVEVFAGAIDDLVAFDPVGRDGKDLLAGVMPGAQSDQGAHPQTHGPPPTTTGPLTFPACPSDFRTRASPGERDSSAAGDGGDDRDCLAVGHRGVEP